MAQGSAVPFPRARPSRGDHDRPPGALRLRDRGRGLGWLRTRQPAQRRSEHHGAGAGSGPAGLALRRVHPHARRPVVPHRQPLLRLAVHLRARAPHGRPPHLPRPGQGAGRVLQHQRHDLPAGQPPRLRAMGRRRGHAALGLRPLPALLQADGDMPRGRRPQRSRPLRRSGRSQPRRRPLRRSGRPQPRRRLPGRDRAPGARAGPGRQRVVRGLPGGHRAGRPPPHQRRQWLPPGGLRRLRPQRAPGPPPQRGPGLPAPRAGPAEPQPRHPGPHHQDPLRSEPGCRRGLHQGTPPPHRERRRGDLLRRGHQLAPTPAALRRGAGRPAGPPQHRRGGRRARSRRQPAGSPGGVRPVRLQAARVDAAPPGQVAPALDRAAMAGPPRARSDQPLRGGRLHPQQRRSGLPQPDVPLPAHRHPLRRHHARRRARLPGARRAHVQQLARDGAHRLGRPPRQACAAVQLPVHRRGLPRVGRGCPPRQDHPQPARHGSLQRR